MKFLNNTNSGSPLENTQTTNKTPTVLLPNQAGNDTKNLYKHGWCQELHQPQA